MSLSRRFQRVFGGSVVAACLFIALSANGEVESSTVNRFAPADSGNGQNEDSGSTSAQSSSSLEASPGITALSGLVLTMNKQPLANVKLELEGITTTTDAAGRFLLADVASGPRMLMVDARPASHSGQTYGQFMFQVVVEPGRTTALPFTVWMPALDTQHAISIPEPTNEEIVATTPRIPGLEVHIPAGIRIRDLDGNLVTSITITPISTERPPFPLPPGVKFPVYFSLQPDGAMIEGTGQEDVPGMQIILPNAAGWPSGDRVDFWTMDPTSGAWIVYGKGTVTADAKHVVPDPGVVIRMLTCSSAGPGPGSPPPPPEAPGAGGRDGEPVYLSTGTFVYQQTDLVLPDVLPLIFTRIYRPGDNATPVRSFGIGMTHSYNMFLFNDTTTTDLILPDGQRILYDNNTGIALPSPTVFYGSYLSQDQVSRTLTLKNGTTLHFELADPLAPQIAFNRFLNRITDQHGNEILINRSSSDDQDILSISSPNGRSIAFSYDSTHRITRATDNLGRTVSYTYDRTGRLSTVTNVGGGVTTYSYDSSNRMTSIKDARQITYLTNTYDTNGRVTKQTQADGTTYLFSYALNNGVVTQTSVTDPRGFIRTVTFNSAGYMTSDARVVGKPEHQTTTYARDPTTNLISGITDSLGRTTAITYDNMANITSITRLAGTSGAVTRSFSYESVFNKLTSVTDPLNHTTSFEYDGSGNLLTLTDPLTHHTTATYNSDGRPATITDAQADVWRFGYNGSDLNGITDPIGNTTLRFLDAGGRLVSSADRSGAITRLAWSALNQITGVTDPLGNLTSSSYDQNGNLLTITDARSNTTTYTYDNMDRLSTRKDPLLHSETYSYDAMGNLTKDTDRKGQVTTLTYDGLNRLTFIGFGTVTQGKTTTYQSTINYTFDAGDRLTQVVDSAGGTITRSYDGLDRLLSETTPQGLVSYSYDAAGRRGTMTITGQPTVTYTSDDADRLVQITQGTTSAVLGYDNANRRSTLTLPNAITVMYGYDLDSQLTSLTYQQSGSTLGNLAYTYDAAGRRIGIFGTFARINLSAAIASAAYNANNQLTNWNGTNLSYDLDGNMTGDGAHTFSWNARNQLSAIGALVFQYDGFGRRTKNAALLNALYDGPNAVEELSGSTPVSLMLNGGVDEAFSRSDSAGTWSFLSDALGSTIALADSAGLVQTLYTYDPYGNSSVTGVPNGNSYQFTGRENDGTGLYYYRARYYNPQLGRFISEDPIGFRGGINVYAYVGNNPISRIDPFGLDWLNNLADFSAGAGSVLTFGLTDLVNDATGASSVVNNCSGWHKAGEWTGIGLSTAIGGAEGLEEGLDREAGEEWSHWIPDRAKQGRGGLIPDFIVDSDLNGQYVSDLEHALNDDSRMLKGMTLADKNPAWLQQLNRIPQWVTGAGAGAAYGGASAALAGHNCGCK